MDEFHRAVQEGDKVTMLLHKSHINSLDSSVIPRQTGATALSQAVSLQDNELALFLLRNGADGNLPNDLGESPVHEAAEQGNLVLLKLLLEHGCELNRLTLDGESVLHKSVCRGDFQMTSFLLSKGAKVNQSNKFQMRTPLHYACIVGNEECIKALLKHGADPQAKDRKEQTPVELCEPELRSVFENENQVGMEMIPEDDNEDAATERKSQDLSKKSLLLMNFLYSLNLEQYFEQLVSVGFDDLESMFEQMNSPMPINEAVLKKCGIHKPGHQKRILMKLRKLAQENTKTDEGQNTCYTFPHGEYILHDWLADIQCEALTTRFQETGYDHIGFLREQAASNLNSIEFALEKEIGVREIGTRRKIIHKLRTEIINTSEINLHLCRQRCEVCLLI